MDQITPDEFAKMRQQLSEVHTALIGNPIIQDGGMVRRLANVEEKVSKIDKGYAKIGIHVKLLWTAAGCVLTGIYTLIIKK